MKASRIPVAAQLTSEYGDVAASDPNQTDRMYFSGAKSASCLLSTEAPSLSKAPPRILHLLCTADLLRPSTMLEACFGRQLRSQSLMIEACQVKIAGVSQAEQIRGLRDKVN